MTIENFSDEEFKGIKQAVRYQEVKLQRTKSIPYNTGASLTQKQIEMSVTNGRGYLSIQNALDVVNSNTNLPKLNLSDVLDNGIVPLYFEKPEHDKLEKPCGEIPLGESDRCILPVLEPPILLERLETRQRIRWMEERRKEDPSTLFSRAA